MRTVLTVITISVILLFGVSAIAQEQDCTPKIGWNSLCSKKAKGDAVAADVLEGKTFSNKDEVDIPGTMVDNGARTFNPGTADQNVPTGYHNGSGTVRGDTDLIASNICSGVTIFGITGNMLCTPIPTVTTATSRVWMDRNLGASQVATSSDDILAYGDLYQWGRLTDGHEKRGSGTQNVRIQSRMSRH